MPIVRASFLALLLGLVVLFAPDAAEAGNRRSACGGVAQRGCCVHEVIPSCDSGLVERIGVGPGAGQQCGTVLGVPVFAAGTCYGQTFPSACGRKDQRACTIFEHIPSCASGLVELLGSGGGFCRQMGADGFPTHCGHDGQPACLVSEHFPSCAPDHFEDGFPGGTCRLLDADGFPQRCGESGEPACDASLQLQLDITACKPGLADYGLCLEPITLRAGAQAWPAQEDAPASLADAERHVFVLHGMTSGLAEPNEPARTLARAGHRVHLVDYASNNALGDPQPMIVRRVVLERHELADPGDDVFGTEVAWSSAQQFTGLTLTLPDVADRLADAIAALVPAGEPVALVGHSMGGLVIRLLLDRSYDSLRSGGRRITEVVTLGSPHDGSNIDLAAWIPLYVPDEGERDFVFGVLGSVAAGTAACSSVQLLIAAQGVFSLFELDSALWPLVAFQACQMEAFHRAVDLSPKTLDDADHPHIRWGLLAGRLGTGAEFFHDGIVPVTSALGIAHDEGTIVVAGHSPLVGAAATQPFVEGIVGTAVDLAAYPCRNGIDDDGDGLEDEADPECSGPSDWSETSQNACGLGTELAALLPGLLAWRARRRARRGARG